MAHFIGSEVNKVLRLRGTIQSARLQNIRTSEHQNILTYFRKNNMYSCSYNIKHCGADNTYCFYPLNK